MTADQVRAALEPFRRAPFWRVRRGVGSMLTMDAGEATPDGRFGTLHVWVCYCDWRLLVDSRAVLRSDELDEQTESRLAVLAGRMLLDASVEAPHARLVFSGGTVLEMTAYEDDRGDDLFVLFVPGSALVARTSGFALEPRTPTA